MLFKFSNEAQKLLLLSLKEKNKLNDSFIGTEHIFLAALSMKDSYICKLLNENNIDYDSFLRTIEKKDQSNKSNYYIFTPVMNNIFNTLSNNRGRKNSEVLVSDIIIEILNTSNSKAILILKKMKVNIRDLLKELNISSKKKSVKKGILNELGVNLNEKFIGSEEVVLERNDEINMIVEILCCKNKNNPLLIGDAGVGKTAIVEELARRIENGDIPYKLRNKKIYSVAMASLVAGTKYRGEFEDKINKLINEVETSDDVILFIDEIHTLVGAGGADGAIDAANILKPYLARGNLKIIGATTKEEYKKYFANDKALSRRFQIVNINEPNREKVKKILLGVKNIYEDYHNVKIPDFILDKIIYYADKYIQNRKFPDKAIDILDEVCVLASISCNKEYNLVVNLDKEINKIIDLKNKALLDGDYKDAIKYSHEEKKLQNKIGKTRKIIFNNNNQIEITEEILLKVMERKTNILFYTYNYNSKEIDKKIRKYKDISIYSDEMTNKTINFTKDIYNNLVNNAINNSLFIRSSKPGLNNYFIDNYINTFFDECNVIRLDISNFRNIDDLLRIDNYNKNDSFIDKIKINSFSIIVIDDLDSADYSIKEFFDKINKYGYYIDRNNEKIEFSNTLFIYNVITSDSIGFNNKEDKENNKLYIDIGDVLLNKLKKVVRVLINNNYHISSREISSLCNKIILDTDKLNNLEFFVRKELSNLDKHIKKEQTIST